MLRLNISHRRGATKVVVLALVGLALLVAFFVLRGGAPETGDVPGPLDASESPPPDSDVAPLGTAPPEPGPKVTIASTEAEAVAEPALPAGPQLSPAEVLKAAGIELAFRSTMTLTGGRDLFHIELGPGRPTVTVKRTPFDPAKRGDKEPSLKAGDFRQTIETKGRRFTCSAEGPGEDLGDVKELCNSISAVSPVGQVVDIDCQSTNIDRDLFTVQLRGEDEAIRECFTAGWVITPGTGKAGFGFRGDVTRDGVVETLEVAADVPDYPAYEELRGCVYPIFKGMAHRMVEAAPGQVSCEIRWDIDGEAPAQPSPGQP